MPTRNLQPAGGRSMRSTGGVCVFLSHRSADKHIAGAIATAFDACGIDYYLDAADAQLQAATTFGDAPRVVAAIERGILGSTHLLGIITPQTRGSWWVPYEIGFSRATARAAGLLPGGGGDVQGYDRAAYLVLPGVSDLPEFIKISTVVADEAGFVAWLRRLVPGFGPLPGGLRGIVSSASRTMQYRPQ